MDARARAERMRASAEEYPADGDGGDDRARYMRLAGAADADEAAAQGRVAAQKEIIDRAVSERDIAAERAIEIINGACGDGLADSWWDDWGKAITQWIAKICEIVSGIAGGSGAPGVLGAHCRAGAGRVPRRPVGRHGRDRSAGQYCAGDGRGADVARRRHLRGLRRTGLRGFGRVARRGGERPGHGRSARRMGRRRWVARRGRAAGPGLRVPRGGGRQPQGRCPLPALRRPQSAPRPAGGARLRRRRPQVQGQRAHRPAQGPLRGTRQEPRLRRRAPTRSRSRATPSSTPSTWKATCPRSSSTASGTACS